MTSTMIQATCITEKFSGKHKNEGNEDSDEDDEEDEEKDDDDDDDLDEDKHSVHSLMRRIRKKCLCFNCLIPIV